MTRTKNKNRKQVRGGNRGGNPKSNKTKQEKSNIKKNLLVNNKKNAGNLKDSKDNKVVQIMKSVKESDSSKSPSFKKPISENQKNSPIKHENKKKRNRKNKKKNILKNENNIGENENPNNDNIKPVIKENKKKNINENVQKSNSKGEKKSKILAVDTVPCPKDIQTQMNDRELDKNGRTLFVRFGKETGLKDRQTLMKTFADKVKEIRPHKQYKNINYVEFESQEQLEEMKSQIEQMQTAGEKTFIDYMGEKGNKGLQNQQLKINPKKLFIRGFPKGTTPSQVKPLFQKCSKVSIPKSKFSAGKSFGYIFFNTESDAKAAFQSAQNLTIGDADVTVVFSKLPTHEILKTDKRQRPHDNDKENKVEDESPSKKQKIDKEGNQDQEMAEEEQEQEEKDKKNDKVDNDLEDMDDDKKEGEDMEEEEGDDMEGDEEESDDKESEVDGNKNKDDTDDAEDDDGGGDDEGD